MANLRKRIQRLTKLRGSVEQKGINSLDLFLVGALAGLYSKKLIIQNDVQSTLKSFDSNSVDLNQVRGSTKEEQSDIEYSETLNAIFKSDRLSNSVSDYVLKLEQEDYSDFSRGFYSGQLDNIAKVFTNPTNTTTLTDFANKSIASMRLESRQTDAVAQNENEVNSKTSKSARQDVVQKETMTLKRHPGIKKKNPLIGKY